MDCTTLIELFDRGKICEIPPMNSIGKLFPEICSYGRTDIAQWLYEKSKEDGNTKVNINAQGDYAFIWSCANGHLATAQWLYEKSKENGNTKVNINAQGDYAFMLSCRNGHLAMAQWLYEKSKDDGNTKVDINAQNDYAFILSCGIGHIATAQWLCTLTPEYTITFDGTNIKYCIKTVQDVIRQELIDGTIEKRYLDANIMNDDGTLCPLCLGDELEKWIQFTDCAHQVCVDCYIDTNSCPYNCKSSVRNIKMIKNLIY